MGVLGILGLAWGYSLCMGGAWESLGIEMGFSGYAGVYLRDAIGATGYFVGVSGYYG